jgi:ABC-type transport system involved in multi-copper enzyme maturation permease subunit
MWNDFSAILWKEYREYIGHFWNKTGIFLVLVVTGGIVFPNVLLGDGGQLEYGSKAVDAVAFFFCYMYSTIISDASFNGERAQGTMQVVLASPLRPHCFFLGKWAWFMIQAAIMLLTMGMCSHLTLWLHWSTPWPNSSDFWFTAVGALFAICACSWVVAANSATSLIVRNPQSARLMGGVHSVAPYVVGIGVNRIFGVGLDLTALAIVGGLCMALAVASFVFAIIVFRSEHVRL